MTNPIDAGNVDTRVPALNISEDLKDQIRIQVDRGRIVWAPSDMYNPAEPELPDRYGFVARDPSTGEALYAVNSMFGGASGTGGTSSGGPGCTSCGENGPGNSLVHLYSGNYTDSVTDLTLPAKGIPLVLTRTYNSQLGWTHNYLEKIQTQADGTLRYTDAQGIPWTFSPHPTIADRWDPPPKLFQRIDQLPDDTYDMTFKDGLVHAFNASGQLTSQRDLNGNEVGLSYDPVTGKLSQVQASSGAWFSFTYTGGYLTGVSDSAGRSVGFVNDGAGRILTETDVLDQNRHYTYDAVTGWMRTKTAFRDDTIVWRMDYDDHGRLVRAEDPEGNARTYAYDFAARKVLYTDRNGASTLYELNDLAKPVRVVDALGNEKAMEYDAGGNKTAEYDARGGDPTLSRNYDDNGNVGEREDPTGAITSYTYEGPSRLKTTTVTHNSVPQVTTNAYATDGTWNLVSTTDALTRVTNYAYTAEGLVESITRPGAATTAFTYFADGSVHTIEDPEGGVTTMTYDAAGHLDTITDPSNNTRNVDIDAKGRLTAMIDAMLQTTSFVYDDDGNRTQVVAPDGDADPNNNPTTAFVYDDSSHMIETIDALGHVTRQEYDAEGNVTARIDARGYRTTMRYDALGRLVETCDALGNCTTMGYCAELAQQACLTIDALGNVTEIEEDVLGRETARIDPLENRTETTYDDLGRRDSVTDSGSHVTAFGYDPLGRLTLVTDALNSVTAYGYDDRGNRTSVEDANHHTTLFEYDLANRLTKETTPIDTITEFTYYLDGSRETKLDGEGQLTTFSYNANRQLTHIDYHGESTADFDYDERGNKTFEQGLDSTRTMTSDDLGRLETVEDVETGKLIVYGYDPAGNRTTMQIDDDVTKYVWDGRGLLTRLTDPDGGGAYRFRYDALRRRTSTTYPNGMTLQTTYDAASQVLAMVYSHPARGVIQSFTYTYVDGNRMSKVFADATAEIYGYDELSRLTNVEYTTTGRQVTYVYDDVGNRQAMTETNGSTPQTTDYEYNDFNQLTSLVGPGGTTTFVYDDNGNQTQKVEPTATTAFTYDARDRLTQVQQLPGGPTSMFGYDTQNLRVRMNDSQGERRIVLEGIEEHAEVDSAGGTTARYDHDPSRVDALLAQDTSAGKHYFVTDALGSVYGLTDTVGLDRARYGYDVYGARTSTLEQVSTPWRFTGRRSGTATTEYTYYRARYLDTTTGAFASEDPFNMRITLSDGLTDTGLYVGSIHLPEPALAETRYAYVAGMPTKHADPLGLFAPRVHRAMTLLGLLPARWRLEFIEVAEDANAGQDAFQNQGTNYFHCMSDLFQSREHAIWLSRNYQRQERARAAEQVSCAQSREDPRLKEAARAIGRGLHAVQDCAAHGGVSLWNHLSPLSFNAWWQTFRDWVPADEYWILGESATDEYVRQFMVLNPGARILTY